MRLFLLTILLFSHQLIQAQILEELCELPEELKENSGMLISSANAIWLHNDSGDQPILYKVNINGKLLKTIRIENARNVDWEDMTKDQQGNVYVGDFGNNKNKRKNLVIYKIPHPDKIKENTVAAQKIAFHYPDQLDFPPDKSNRHFDLEAMIAFGNHLYIFTKNRTEPYNSITKCYQLPTTPGDYTALYIDNYNTRQQYYFLSITAAALSPDQKKLALLNGSTVWIFSEFQGHQFFKGKVKKIDLKHISQKEAIDFVDNQTLYISDEENSVVGGQKLYKLILEK